MLICLFLSFQVIRCIYTDLLGRGTSIVCIHIRWGMGWGLEMCGLSARITSVHNR